MLKPKRKPLTYRTCPVCGGRATKIVHLSAPANEAVECQECGHKYAFPEPGRRPLTTVKATEGQKP